MPKTGEVKDSGLKKFFRENKSLAFMLPLLGVLVIVLIIIYFGGGKPKDVAAGKPTSTPSASAAGTTPGSGQQQVEVLPQTERTNEEVDKVVEGTRNGQDGQKDALLQDPFKTPMKLTGVLLYSNGDATAIIEYGGVSYIVAKEQPVGDTKWKVLDINESGAMLESNGQTVTLGLNMEHSSPSDETSKSNNDATVTIKLNNADLRDALSAIALNMKCSVVFTGESRRINLDVRNFTPEDALSTALKTVAMDYFRNGNTIIVGTKEKLSKDFVNNMMISKFALRYVTSDMISSQIDTLGLDVKKFTVESNTHAIWVQGFPQELAAVGQLVSMLDKPENVYVEQTTTSTPPKLTPIELTYITADQMNSVLSGIGLNPGLILDTNPKTLYVYATPDQLSLINDLQKKLDVASNQKGSDLVISTKKLQFVKVSEIVPIIKQFGLNVDVIALDRLAMTIWLKGDAETISQASALIEKIDTQQILDDGRFFIKKLTNITAKEAETRLKQLNIPEITTYTFSYPQFAKSILVVCPPDYQLIAKNYLSEMDVATDRIKIPIDYSDDPAGSYLLSARRDLIVSLTGIPATSFTISQNVSRVGTSPHYVLILEETQEKIKMVQDLIKQIDSPIQ